MPNSRPSKQRKKKDDATRGDFEGRVAAITGGTRIAKATALRRSSLARANLADEPGSVAAGARSD